MSFNTGGQSPFVSYVSVFESEVTAVTFSLSLSVRILRGT